MCVNVISSLVKKKITYKEPAHNTHVANKELMWMVLRLVQFCYKVIFAVALQPTTLLCRLCYVSMCVRVCMSVCVRANERGREGGKERERERAVFDF